MAEQDDYCLELLQKLVNISSVFPHEEEIMLFLETELLSHGLSPKRIYLEPDRPNLLCSIGKGHPRVCLNAHSDTVPPGENSRASATIDGDLLWGLGACDDKASIAAMVTAFRNLAAPAGDRIAGGVDLLISVDEEGGGKGVQSAIEQGYTCDYAIVGEPTGLDVVHAHSGILFLNLTTTGVAAHGSTPELGRSAIQRMMELVNEIKAAVTDFAPHPAVGAPTLNLGEIHAGDRPNRVADLCRARVDVRIMPPATVAQVKGRVDEVLADKSWAEYEVERQWEPVETPLDCPLVRSVAEAAAELGVTPRIKGWRGGTEAEPFRRMLGVDAIVLGPGDLAVAHSDSEYVSISQTRLAVRLYEAAVLRLLAGGG